MMLWDVVSSLANEAVSLFSFEGNFYIYIKQMCECQGLSAHPTYMGIGNCI